MRGRAAFTESRASFCHSTRVRDVKGDVWRGQSYVELVRVCMPALSKGLLHRPISRLWANALQTALGTTVVALW